VKPWYVVSRITWEVVGGGALRLLTARTLYEGDSRVKAEAVRDAHPDEPRPYLGRHETTSVAMFPGGRELLARCEDDPPTPLA
jgi:hypothetical protein